MSATPETIDIAEIREVEERDELQNVLQDLTDWLLHKTIGDGRIYDVDAFRVKVQAVKVAIQAVRARRELIKDKEDVELEQALRSFEEALDLVEDV